MSGKKNIKSITRKLQHKSITGQCIIASSPIKKKRSLNNYQKFVQAESKKSKYQGLSSKDRIKAISVQWNKSKTNLLSSPKQRVKSSPKSSTKSSPKLNRKIRSPFCSPKSSPKLFRIKRRNFSSPVKSRRKRDN